MSTGAELAQARLEADAVPIILWRKHSLLRSTLCFPEVTRLFQLKHALLLVCLFSIPACPGLFATDTGASAHFEQGLDALFNKRAFSGRQVQLAWENGGSAYTILEPAAAGGKGVDIVAYDTATGKRSVQISAAQLTPAGARGPLDILEYSWSPDGKQLLVFTNAKKVWREDTRGDYWIYDTTAQPENRLTRLGGDAPESTLMFATFSPDGKSVAWVRGNNIYAEQLATRKITQLTADGSAEVINGTSDWVNEEELFLRNCIRWSPDSRKIAYWQ